MALVGRRDQGVDEKGKGKMTSTKEGGGRASFGLPASKAGMLCPWHPERKKEMEIKNFFRLRAVQKKKGGGEKASATLKRGRVQLF